MPYIAFPAYSFRKKQRYFRSLVELISAYRIGDLNPKWVLWEVHRPNVALSVPILLKGFTPHWDNGLGMYCIPCLAETFRTIHWYMPDLSEDRLGFGVFHYRTMHIFGRVPCEFKLEISLAEGLRHRALSPLGTWNGSEGEILLMPDQFDSIEKRISDRTFTDLVVSLYFAKKEGVPRSDPPPFEEGICRAEFDFRGD